LSKTRLALFVVDRGRRGAQVQALTLPINYPKLAAQAAAFRAACADPRKPYRARARELHRRLFAKAEPHLRGIKRLVICPDGALWDVPFAALSAEGKRINAKGKKESGTGNGERFLAQRYEIAYAYSATGVQAALAARAGRKQPERSLLALANPDLGSSK